MRACLAVFPSPFVGIAAGVMPAHACVDVFDVDADAVPGGDGGWLNSWDFNITQGIEWHHEPCSHNIAFMDGHVDFVGIRKGLHITLECNVLPFESLVLETQARQEEVPCGQDAEMPVSNRRSDGFSNWMLVC